MVSCLFGEASILAISFTGTGNVVITTFIGFVPSKPLDKLKMFALVWRKYFPVVLIRKETKLSRLQHFPSTTLPCICTKTHGSDVIFPASTSVFHLHEVIVRVASNWWESFGGSDRQLEKMPRPRMVTEILGELKDWRSYVDVAARIFQASVWVEI